MTEVQKQSGPLRWASRLLRISNHMEYDAWSESSLQDIEQLVRRTCKSAGDDAPVCHEEFLAARERLLQWLGGCHPEGSDWSSTKSIEKPSRTGSGLAGNLRQMQQHRGNLHRRSYSMPTDDLGSPPLSPYCSQDSVSTAHSKRVLLMGPGIPSGDMGIDFDSHNLQSNESDELSPFLMPETTCSKPLRLKSFRSRMQKAFRRTGYGLNDHVDSSLSPLLADC